MTDQPTAEKENAMYHGPEEACPVCGAPQGEAHGASQDPATKQWSVTCAGPAMTDQPTDHSDEEIAALIEKAKRYGERRDGAKQAILRVNDAIQGYLRQFGQQVPPELVEYLSELDRTVHDLEFPPNQKPSIIGRERALIDGLTKVLHGSIESVRFHPRHDPTPTSETRRGSTFEVAIRDPDGQPTGHVARVTIELDRLEQP